MTAASFAIAEKGGIEDHAIAINQNKQVRVAVLTRQSASKQAIAVLVFRSSHQKILQEVALRLQSLLALDESLGRFALLLMLLDVFCVSARQIRVLLQNFLWSRVSSRSLAVKSGDSLASISIFFIAPSSCRRSWRSQRLVICGGRSSPMVP